MFKKLPSVTVRVNEGGGFRPVHCVCRGMEISGRLSSIGFFCVGDASTREMLSSWCLYFSSLVPRKVHLKTSLGTIATISAYGLIHCAFIEHQEECGHCSGDGHQAGQVCLH